MTVRVYINQECEYCGSDEHLQNYYGTTLCEECIDFERDFDMDQYEEQRRQSIVESEEY